VWCLSILNFSQGEKGSGARSRQQEPEGLPEDGKVRKKGRMDDLQNVLAMINWGVVSTRSRGNGFLRLRARPRVGRHPKEEEGGNPKEYCLRKRRKGRVDWYARMQKEEGKALSLSDRPTRRGKVKRRHKPEKILEK